MNNRSGEGMMDFEYENKTGPVDFNSPFLQHATQNPYQHQHRIQSTDSLAKKRPHSVLDSPSKSNFPSLRDPTSQSTFLFARPPSSPTKELPPPPLSDNPAFNTPRTKADATYDSSEVDASSPEYNADTDATPDKMGFRSGLSKTTNNFTQLMTPEKRGPALTRLNGVSGRGELARPSYSLLAENKIRKKRTRIGGLVRRKDSSTSDSGDDKGKRTGHHTPAGPGAIASIFGFIETHPGLPHILSFYAQLLLNFFLVFFFMYLVYCFWATIRADVDKKAQEAMGAILAEVGECNQRYQDNKCEREARVPALESACNEWDRCRSKDPRAVGRARVSAHTFAEIFNSFIEPISWKAMIFTMALVFGCVGVSNFAFGFFRNKAHPLPPRPPPTPSHPYIPTPQRHPSDSQSYQYAAYQSPGRRNGDMGNSGLLEQWSPMRRLQY